MSGNVDWTLVAIGVGNKGETRPTVSTVFRVRNDKVHFEAPDYSEIDIVGYEWYKWGNLVKSCGDTFRQQPLLADDFETGDTSRWHS